MKGVNDSPVTSDDRYHRHKVNLTYPKTSPGRKLNSTYTAVSQINKRLIEDASKTKQTTYVRCNTVNTPGP